MKTKQLILLLVAVALVGNVFATKLPKMNFIALQDSKALLAYEQAEPARNEIRIVTDEGHIVYYKESKSADFRQLFDLSALDDGDYTVKVKNGVGSAKRDIEIQNGVLSVKPLKTEYSPIVYADDNIIKVSYLNFDRNDVSFGIYNNGESLYTSSLGSEFVLHRGFDISVLNEGTYSVKFTTPNEVYWFSVAR